MPAQVRSLSLWDVQELLGTDGGAGGEERSVAQPAAATPIPIGNVAEAAWEMRGQVFRKAAELARVSPEQFAAMPAADAAGWLKALNGQEYPLEKLGPLLVEWAKRLKE